MMCLTCGNVVPDQLAGHRTGRRYLWQVIVMEPARVIDFHLVTDDVATGIFGKKNPA